MSGASGIRSSDAPGPSTFDLRSAALSIRAADIYGARLSTLSPQMALSRHHIRSRSQCPPLGVKQISTFHNIRTADAVSAVEARADVAGAQRQVSF